jgi:putative membrane protein
MRTIAKTLGRAALLSLLCTGAAHAQFGNPGGMLPDTAEARPGLPAPGQANVQDRLFIKLLGMGNAGEMEAGRLADARASNQAVKAFARKMVEDHGAAARKLSAAARPLDVVVPLEPDPDQKAARARLEALEGQAFDVAYLDAQLVDHQKAVTLLEWVISNGQDAGIQAFAKETLFQVQGHLLHVQALRADVMPNGPEGATVGQKR